MIKKLISLLVLPISLISVSCGSKTGNVVILYTSNINGSIDKELSYASLKKLKSNCLAKRDDVLIFDCGDHLSGSVYCALDNGKGIINLMNEVGYDISTLGEGEFNWDMTQLGELIKSANFPYLSSNFYHYNPDNKQVLDPFCETSKIIEVANKKIGVFALTTPYVTNYVNPNHFKNEKNQYVYTFFEENDDFYNKAQREIDYLKNNGADYVICLSHLGDNEAHKFNSISLIKKTSGINAVIDGHSHDVNPIAYIKNKNNSDVLLSQIGKDFNHIGKLTILKNGIIDIELISKVSDCDTKLSIMQSDIINEVNAKFNVPVAFSYIDFKRNLLKTSNLGDISADSLYFFFNYVLTDPKFGSQDSKCNFAIESSGALNESIEPSVWSLLTCRKLFASNNGVCVKLIKGKLLRKYFEFVTNDYDINEFAGLAQVSSTIKISINSEKKSDIVIDSAHNYISGPTNEWRIMDIKIYNTESGAWEELDDEQYYRVGSTDFVLNGGYGARMFEEESEDCKTIFSSSYFLEYQIFGYYLSNFAPSQTSSIPLINTINAPFPTDIKSTSNINYEQPTGASRINSIDG